MLKSDLRQRIDRPELLDGVVRPDAELDGNLRDLGRINRWTGADVLRHRALRRLLVGLPGRSFSLLDVGGGGGDGLAGGVRWAERRGLRCRALLLDRSCPILLLARRRLARHGSLLSGDGRRLPLQDRSVDVAMSALVLHHCTAEDAVALLQEMARVSRLGVIVDDLLRGHLGYLGALALGRFLTRNRLTRHDGPLSVRRAFTRPELAVLLAAAGLWVRWQATIPGYRTIIVAVPSGERRR